MPGLQAFSLTTTASVEIPRVGLPKDYRKAEALLHELAAKELIASFPARLHWRSFNQQLLRLDTVRIPGAEASGFVDEIAPRSIMVSADLYDRLSIDAATFGRTNAAYEKAKDRLYALATKDRSYGLARHAAEAMTLLTFIEACNKASADHRMANWYDEKTLRVRHEFEDMIRRKNTSHPGYERAADSASGMLYSFDAPYAYRSTPPSPHQVEQILK